MSVVNRKDWVLYSPEAPEGVVPPIERPHWVSDLCASTERLGSDGQFIALPEVACGNWQCGWLEGYLGPGCLAGAFFSSGKYIAALLQPHTSGVVAQPGLVSDECVGAYKIPLFGVPRSRAEMAALFEEAYKYLRDGGLLGPHYDRGLNDAGT